jgi:aryl-alcohol dehydrogenase-like predicted oxidoreductase
MSRRSLVGAMAAGAATLAARPSWLPALAAPITRAIPSSGEQIPVVGLGSWSTFNVGRDAALRDECTEVIRAFLSAGGRMIDSSPMYGSSQDTIGYALGTLGRPATVFSADKVWTTSGSDGPEQVEESRVKWGIHRFDLLQVHNLVAWEAHLATLTAMKKEGRLRYVGITTSSGRRHDEIEQVMRQHPIDFVQGHLQHPDARRVRRGDLRAAGGVLAITDGGDRGGLGAGGRRGERQRQADQRDPARRGTRLMGSSSCSGPESGQHKEMYLPPTP